MSDFDKEAERERLREKFARDEEKRADTKRMSELLLKGATMTNRHCDACGDPIFRHEGREFCATCQSGEAAAAAERTPTEGGDEGELTDADGAVEGTDGPVDGDGVAAEAAEAADDSSGTRSPTDDVERTERAGPTGTERSPERRTPTTESRGGTTDTAGRADASSHPTEARASLVRTLSKHATAAEAADDPRVATDHLEAARAAAETLRALDGR